MTDSYTQVPPDSTGDKIDTEQLTVSAQTVERQRIQIAGSVDTQIAPVDGTAGLKVDLGADNDVTVGGSLPAGTNNIGDVDVLTIAAGDNNIGNVDVETVIPGTGATQLGKAVSAVPGATDSGVAALVIRDDALAGLTEVDGDYSRMHVDANGALWVIPNGTTTVDGTVILGAGTAEIGKLAAGSANIGDVDVLTMPSTAAEAAALPAVVTVVAGDDGTDTHILQQAADGDLKITLDSEAVVLGAGTAEIGKLAAGTANIGDVDVLTVPALVTGSAKIGSTLSSGTHLWDNLAGAPGEAEVKFAVVDVASAADNQIVALVSSKSIRVLSYVLVASGGANTLTWKSATAGNISGGMGVADTGGISANSETGLFATTAGEALELTLSAATSVDGHISYIEVD
jgi:uncharacterized protein YaiI (UPF0178 family)